MLFADVSIHKPEVSEDDNILAERDLSVQSVDSLSIATTPSLLQAGVLHPPFISRW